MLSQVRRQVFIQEQGVPETMEWDGLDNEAVHLLAVSAGTGIGCARILEGGRIGRMAVVLPWRGRGVGSALLAAAVNICRQRGWRQVTLSAQMHAVGFYAHNGFGICSEEYQDAGILHCDMQLMLTN